MPDHHLLDFFESPKETNNKAFRVIIYLLIAFFCIVNPLIGILIDDIVWSFNSVTLRIIIPVVLLFSLSLMLYASIYFIGLFLAVYLKILHQKFPKSWIKTLSSTVDLLTLQMLKKVKLSGIVLLLQILLFLIIITSGIFEYDLWIGSSFQTDL